MNKQRHTFIDMLRIIACFLVIVNHTNSDIFITSTPQSMNWWLSLTYFFISKTAVPLFIMITGFNLLDRQESYKRSYSRLLRVVVILFVFSLVYYIYQCKTGVVTSPSVYNYFETVLNYYITNSFWYMYVYIGILLMLPFLARLARSMEKHDLHVFIGISLAVNAVIPVLGHYFPIVSYSPMIDLAIFDSYICLMMIAYYLKKYVVRSRRGLIIAVAGAILPLVYNVLMTKLEYDMTGGVNYLFYDNRDLLPIVIQSVSIFYLAMYVNCGDKLAAVFKVVGSCTFGIYLISDLVIAQSYFMYTAAAEVIYRLPAMVLFEIAVFAVGFGIIFVIRLIPGVKRWL